jgi:hypothetical protein
MNTVHLEGLRQGRNDIQLVSCHPDDPNAVGWQVATLQDGKRQLWCRKGTQFYLRKRAAVTLARDISLKLKLPYVTRPIEVQTAFDFSIVREAV